MPIHLGNIVQTGGIITANGSGISAINASNLSTGTVPIARLPTAAASDMESASSSHVVTPSVQQRHPSAAKAWAYVTVSGGTGTIQAAYNIASVTHPATGVYAVFYSTAMSSGNYCVMAIADNLSGVGNLTCAPAGKATNGTSILFTNGPGTLVDPSGFYVVVYGDQ